MKEVAPPGLEVAPPRRGSPSEAGWCNRPGQAVALLGLNLRVRLGGATAPVKRWHRLGSVSERDWAVQPLLTEVAPPELGLRALAGEVQPPQSGGGTA